MKERDGEEVDEETGFYKKSREMSEDEDLARVNPMFKSNQAVTNNNCMLCTTAYELRRRGYDVMAKTANVGFTDDYVSKWFKNAKQNNIESDLLSEFNRRPYVPRINNRQASGLFSEITSSIAKQPNGARGNFIFSWRGVFGAGHSIVYQVKNGKVEFLDAQSNKRYSEQDMIKLCKSMATASYIRLDNLKLNYKEIKEVAS